jgi:integrase
MTIMERTASKFFVDGKRHRQRIGPNLREAEAVLGKKRAEIREGRFFAKPTRVTTTFSELADAYMEWISPNEAKGIPARKRSWKSFDLYVVNQLRRYFGDTKIIDITPAMVSQYRDVRRATICRRKIPVSVATVNRELAVIRRMYTVALRGLIALKGGTPMANLVAAHPTEREHNERDRVLSADEFAQVYDAAKTWLKPILLMAYHAGTRQEEIRSLRWDQIDLKAGLIRLKSGDTKTNEGRIVPLNQTLTALLKSATRYMNCSMVFPNPLKLGSPDPRYKDSSIGHAFVRACQKAGVQDATFHDLRHTFVTNARRSGVDAITTMAITGHKTMAVFKRYNMVDTSDLHAALRQMEQASATKTAIAVSEPLQENDVTPRNSSRSRRSSAGRATDS